MLAQILSDTASRYPNGVAISYGEHQWTWSELRTAVEKLTRGLADLGISPNQEVGIWLNNTPCFVISFFAVLARGAIVAALNPAMKRGDCSSRLGKLAAVITSNRLENSCRNSIGATDPSGPVVIVCPDSDDWDEWGLLENSPMPPQTCMAKDRALLQFSSGSTGKPKPLYRTNRECLAEIRHFQDTCQVVSNDRIFCALPLFHAHGMANALWSAVSSGATLMLMKNPQPFQVQWGRALTILETERATIFPGVPLMFQALADAPTDADLSSLRLCFSAGTALSRRTFDKFLNKFGVPIRQLYGCTEAGSVSINLDSNPGESADSVGQPMQGVEIAIVGENEKLLPCGETGEVTFRSAAATNGYEDNDDLNARCFRDGWFFTGDMGWMSTSGRLRIVGRKQFVITVAGHKVFANEVEDVLCQHIGVAEVAVIGIPDERFGEVIKAFVVPKSEYTTSDELREFVKAELPKYKRPHQLEFVSALPKTPLGKIAKDQLR